MNKLFSISFYRLFTLLLCSLALAGYGATPREVIGNVAGEIIGYSGCFAQPENQKYDNEFLRAKYVGTTSVDALVTLFSTKRHWPSKVYVGVRTNAPKSAVICQISYRDESGVVVLALVFEYDGNQIVRDARMYFTTSGPPKE